MSANYTEYYVQLVNKRTGQTIDDDTGLYTVMTAADPTAITCYSDEMGTSLTLPGTMTDGVIRFFTASSVTSVDISVLTADGHAFFIEALTPSQHRIDVDVEKYNGLTFVVPYSMASGCDALWDTGFNLIAGMKIKSVFLHSTTASTASGLLIGVSGTTSSFLANVSTTATGFKIHDAPIYTNATGSANYISATQIRGSLICDWTYGLVTATVAGQKGYWVNKDYLVTAATSLVYMVAATNSGGTGEGYIYIEYSLCPTAGN